MKKELKVEGMMCPHCEKHCVDSLLEVDGVVNAKASFENKKVIIELSKEVDEDVLKNAIKEAGYTPL